MPDQPKDPVDPKSFLLPKKDSGPSPLSVERVNAGALLAQEQKAELPKTPAAQPEQKSSGLLSGPDPKSPAGQTFAPTAPPTPPAKKEETTSIKPLETYSGDISKVIETGNVSSVTIAAAEAERRAEEPAPEAAAAPRRVSLAMWVTGGMLILCGIGVVAALLLRPAPQAGNAAGPEAPFMTVDHATAVVAAQGGNRDDLMNQLVAARQKVSLSLGLVEWLFVATTTANTAGLMPAQQLFSLIAPNMPQDLLRTIEPVYLLGVHSFDENQAFLVVRVDSYQQAYSGMLAWEQTMPQELAPLFNRHPSPHLPTDTLPSTTTPEFIQTGFVDRTVENHDARVMQNNAGDILLLWTFLDRNTIAITTNEYTLREITRRLNTASLVPQPQ